MEDDPTILWLLSFPHLSKFGSVLSNKNLDQFSFTGSRPFCSLKSLVGGLVMGEKPESSSVRTSEDHQPERPECPRPIDRIQKNVAFATLLAIYEKTGSCFGTLAFIWATVVILGGFAKDLKIVEFHIVSILLVIEGVRIVCRRSEFRVPRISLLYIFLVCVQISAALATLLLGSYGFFISFEDHNSLKKHSLLDLSTQYTAIGYFYGFCIADGLFIFVGQGFMFLIWFLGSSRFFPVFSYSLYVRYVKGSIFEGRETGVLSLAVELLQSTDDEEQLAGVRVLLELLDPLQSTDADEINQRCRFYRWMNISDPIPEKTLWAALTKRDVVERLIQMRNWEKHGDIEIRKAADRIGSIMKPNPNLIVLPPELRSALTRIEE